MSSRNVLLDGVVAIGASDAGIYVGQSTNIIARNSQAAFNVAGLEIENCHFADVYNNVLTDNTGVFWSLICPIFLNKEAITYGSSTIAV